MMKGNQSWVTYAGTDEEGIKALMLARSLRNVITRRFLTIFVSYALSEELRELVEAEFDRCITIHKKPNGLPFSQLAKINCWGLSKLKKFVFLDCNSIVIVNSDELFKHEGLMGFKDEGEIITEASLFVDSPSKSMFKKLTDYATLKNDDRKYNLEKLPFGSLNKSYNIVVDLDGNNSDLNLCEIKIFRFVKSHPIDMLSNGNKDQSVFEGILEQALFSKAMEFLPFQIISKYFQPSPTMAKKIQELCTSVAPAADLEHLEHLQDSVAIVGMSFRFPGANNLDEFWDLLVNEKEGIIKVPQGRWSKDQCFGSVRTENTKQTEAGFLNCPIDQLDAKFFGLSPMEASYVDPQQLLTLQVIWEAIEHAGINPASLKKSKTGVFGGWWRTDYKEMLQESGINEQDFFRIYMGNALGTLTGRISHILELTGPSISTESGCSTSMVAVDMACKSLLNEDCDVGLAFGVNLLLHPFTVHTMNSVIAMDGRCKTFDAKADGFGRAEGCSVLVLKRYSDAVRDGNRVWGLIRGSAVVQEGPSRSMGTPTVECEALAMELALADARVAPSDVSFVETHGTGTPIGDPLEVAAIAKVYSKQRQNPLIIGSVKTNIGHTESCSGIAGIIKTVLALQNSSIPPHRNFETLNPEINLEEIPAILPLTPFKWEGNLNGKPRIAGVSSFGITGTDAHVIIQETPASTKPGLRLHSEMPLHTLKISAKSPEALRDLQVSYKAFLETTKEDLIDICHTASIGRGDFPYRSVIIGSNKAEIIKNLDRTSSDLIQAPNEPPKICFLFTGQGAQYPGMAKALYDHSPIFKIHFDNCENILLQVLGISIKNTLWGDNIKDLSRTIYSQTSIFCIEFCLLKLWESWGIKPDVVLGHSLGEFAAAVAAGILTFADALTLVAERSRLIGNLPSGKMLVIKECQEKVDLLLKEAFSGSENWLDYAAINSEDQTVLAGSEENVLKFEEFCLNNSIKTHIIQSTHAFHSRYMEPILEEYRKTASRITYRQPKCTFISGMDGIVKDIGEVNADYWVRHTRDPVRFTEACKTVLETGSTLFLEIGPQPILSALMMANAETLNYNKITCLSSMRRKEADWSTTLTTLGTLYKQGIEVNWKQFHQFSGGKIVTLPFYCFQNKSYWFDFSKGGRQKPIHPLVGTPMPNASQIKLFQNELNVFSTTYLKDHVIGSTIIMPGAGFLEMCLVAGQAAYQGYEGGYLFPSTALTLDNFFIEAPLALNEIEPIQTQVVVNTEDTGETRVTIYSKCILDKETSKWIRHASAIFHPYAVGVVETNDTFENIKTRCTEKLESENTYDKFSEFGIKFGPTFQNLVDGYEGENDIFFEISQPNVNTDDYILHPVIIDAMFQAIAIASNPNATQLHVPISITRFIWHSKLSTRTSYVHSSKNIKRGEDVATLYDENGKRIVTMVGVSLLETNVNTVMSAIEAQRTCLPGMYQETWKDELSPCGKRVPSAFDNRIYGEEIKAKYRFNPVGEEKEIYYGKSNQLCSLYIIRALRETGWNPKINQVSSLNVLINTLQILPSFERMTRYMLTILVEDGYLETVNANNLNDFGFKVTRFIPYGQELSEKIDKLYLELNPEKNVATVSVGTVAKNLGQILSGKQSALSIMFPEDSNEMGLAEQYYYNSHLTKTVSEVSEELAVVFLEETIEPLERGNKVLRILEVGAGTGSFTKGFLACLKSPPSAYEYTYTDISSIFFSKGEKVFENSQIKVTYKTLNIEEDPTLQGFIPHHYDVVCASFVIHATKDVRKSVSNLRNLLRPGGQIVVTELTKPLRDLNLVFGVLEGFWAFTDYDLRPHNCEMSTEKWEEVFRTCHFTSVSTFNAYNDHSAIIFAKASADNDYIHENLPADTSLKTWLMFSNTKNTDSASMIEHKLTQIGRQVQIAYPADNVKNLSDQNDKQLEMKKLFNHFSSKNSLEGVIYFIDNLDTDHEKDAQFIYQQFLSLCQVLVGLDPTKLFVVTRGIHSLGDHEITSPFAGPILGMLKALLNENHVIACRCIDMDPTSSLQNSIEEAFSELFINDGELAVAHRETRRNLCRFNALKLSNTSLSFPKTGRSRLILPSSNAIQDLRFGPAVTDQIESHEVEVEVKAFSLNFRDLLVILKPDSQFDDWNSVGLDYSGVITAIGSQVTRHKVGDHVIGANLKDGALPSHLTVSENVVVTLPKGLTFNEGATLPAVGVTSYLSFVEGNKLKQNDTILIHTGSGGVGLFAIQVAKRFNCNIVATAGSARKRSYLKFLGIKHVFNSRNTDYGTQIREALGGEGVDFVLNSLTGSGFKEATLGLCKPGARFIEISKLNIWTPEQVKELRPDVRYEIVDASASAESELQKYMTILQENLNDSKVKPLPYVRFDASDIREALIYLQKAKHIGKIICVMPQQIAVKGSPEKIMPLFNDQSTYLITGGLGGIGIEIAKWMTRTGAKYIVLVGRNEPNERAMEEIKMMESNGANIMVEQCDVSDFNQCQSLLASLNCTERNLPTLRGIMHAAGVLSDGFYPAQTWQKYEESFNPKIKGAWNLHLLTLEYPLEHFVMFSSAAAIFGSLGQSNHAAANAFLDAFAHYRNSFGLPATSVNWGQWGQVGVAANLDVVGLKPMSSLQCVSALEKLLKHHCLQSSVLEADFALFKKIFPGITKRFLSDLKHTDTEKAEAVKVNSEEFWKEYESSKDTENRTEVVRKYIRSAIRQVLKLEESDALDDNGNLQDIGMDSLMTMEMKNVLQTLIGDRAKITVNSVKDCKTINQLAARIVELISGAEELPPPTREELNLLIREDAVLPLHIKTHISGCKPSEVRTILITGVTGNLGPYVLSEILKRPHIQKVYCLMRTCLKTVPESRLKKVLSDKNITVNFDKTECVVGNVIQKQFGLEEETYLKLANEVDAVFHLAVKASFQDVYQKRPESDSDIRTVNVFGTKNVLEFACLTKTKLVYHASATISVSKLDENKCMAENWPMIDDFDELPNDAYPISKFISDRLIAEAVGRGIPCKVFRFPFIGGDSKTGGNISVLNNSLLLRMMAYLHLGMMPAFSVPFMILPVDHCAEISTRIFFDDDTGHEVYNVHNPKVNDEQELEDIAEEFGYKVETVEPEEFEERLKTKEDSEILFMIKRGVENQQRLLRPFETNIPEAVRAWLVGSKNVFTSKKLEKLIPEYPNFMETALDILKRDLWHAKNSGIFKKLGV